MLVGVAKAGVLLRLDQLICVGGCGKGRCIAEVGSADLCCGKGRCIAEVGSADLCWWVWLMSMFPNTGML